MYVQLSQLFIVELMASQELGWIVPFLNNGLGSWEF